MPLNTFDDKSTLVQVMAWCHQTKSHYLSQCWPTSDPSYGVTRPQWVKETATGDRLIFMGEHKTVVSLVGLWWKYCSSALNLWGSTKFVTRGKIDMIWKLFVLLMLKHLTLNSVSGHFVCFIICKIPSKRWSYDVHMINIWCGLC